VATATGRRRGGRRSSGEGEAASGGMDAGGRASRWRRRFRAGEAVGAQAIGEPSVAGVRGGKGVGRCSEVRLACERRRKTEGRRRAAAGWRQE
jgi:hypothetical protein